MSPPCSGGAPPRDENGLPLRYAVERRPAVRSGSLWCREPADESDWRVLQAPPSVARGGIAPEHAYQNLAAEDTHAGRRRAGEGARWRSCTNAVVGLTSTSERWWRVGSCPARMGGPLRRSVPLAP